MWDKKKTNTKSLLLDYISNPFLLALPLAIFIILLLPDVFDKYEVHLVKSTRADKPRSVEEYHDLNGDGYSERVIAFPSTIGLPSVKVLDNNGGLIGQWNFTGKYANRGRRFFCCDLDKDGNDEVYIFTLDHDSLFMNAIEPFPFKEYVFRRKLISKIGTFDGKTDLSIGKFHTYDFNDDQYNDLLFTVNGGFSKQPRSLFIYDAKNDSLTQSKPMGAVFRNIIITDLNKDDQPEIFCATNTRGNIHDSLGIPFNDYSSWLFAFDKHLEFLFPPIEFNAYPSGISIAKSKDKIAVLFSNNSNSDLPSFKGFIDLEGKIANKQKLQGQFQSYSFFINPPNIQYQGKPGLLLRTTPQGTLIVDEELDVVNAVKLKNMSYLFLKTDLDSDGKQEYLFKDMEQSLVILREEFTDPVVIDINQGVFPATSPIVTVKENGIAQRELFIKLGDQVLFYTYGFNRLFYLKFPVWSGIYLVVSLLILFIRFLQKRQLRQKMEIENRLNELQLKTIKSQMDPHFMFNALNNISTNIKFGDSELAYEYTIKFSALLRNLFIKADELSVALISEIGFTRDYLELVQLKFGEQFSYIIEVDDDVNKSKPIPRMLIQLFAENAVKHGLSPNSGSGTIGIKVSNKDGNVHIFVEDDGIGRKAAATKTKGDGRGLIIIKEMISLYLKITGRQISYLYVDLTDGQGNPSGTRAEIVL